MRQTAKPMEITCKDHLGNNRMVIDSDGNVCQRTDYYPYGTPFSAPSDGLNATLQPYKYNGKEFDNMHGLNTYDYGARQYYSVLPIWDRPDPLAEDYYHVSPYMYCAGNPMKFIDFDGKFIAIAGENDQLYYYNIDDGGFYNSEGEKYSGDRYQYLFICVSDCLGKLNSTETGKELVSFLANHELGVLIGPGKFSENIADNNRNDNVKSIVGFSWRISNSDTPSFISLGHELAHSQDRLNGTIDMSDWMINPEETGHPIPKAEIYSTFIENKLRKENNLPLRKAYTIDRDTNSWDYHTRIIDDNNRSLYFFQNGSYLPNYKKISHKRRASRYQF